MPAAVPGHAGEAGAVQLAQLDAGPAADAGAARLLRLPHGERGVTGRRPRGPAHGPGAVRPDRRALFRLREFEPDPDFLTAPQGRAGVRQTHAEGSAR